MKTINEQIDALIMCCASNEKKKKRTMNASEMHVCIEVLTDWCTELEKRIAALEKDKK